MTQANSESIGGQISLRALKPEGLSDFRALLGSCEFGGCFCAIWSSYDNSWVSRCKDPAQPNYKITEARVLAGDNVGYLVYRDSELVGWTGSGPKSTFPFLAAKLASRLSPSTDNVWAVGCLAIKEGERGKGISEKIIAKVTDLAREAGASTIEAYPTRPWDEARSFRGSESLYRRLGFEERGKEKDGESEILLMQKPLVRNEAAGVNIEVVNEDEVCR